MVCVWFVKNVNIEYVTYVNYLNELFKLNNIYIITIFCLPGRYSISAFGT